MGQLFLSIAYLISTLAKENMASHKTGAEELMFIFKVLICTFLLLPKKKKINVFFLLWEFLLLNNPSRVTVTVYLFEY